MTGSGEWHHAEGNAMSKTIDLASLSAKEACEKGFELELRHPVTNEPLGVFIGVVGSESEAFQQHVRKKANERLRKQFTAQRKGGDDAPTIEQAESDAIDLLVACTTSWRTGDEPTIKHSGKSLEFNETNVRFLYAERWIRAQVDEAVGDLGNFLAA